MSTLWTISQVMFYVPFFHMFYFGGTYFPESFSPKSPKRTEPKGALKSIFAGSSKHIA